MDINLLGRWFITTSKFNYNWRVISDFSPSLPEIISLKQSSNEACFDAENGSVKDAESRFLAGFERWDRLPIGAMFADELAAAC